MLVLGWHGNSQQFEFQDDSSGISYHDGAAAILRDGVVVAALEEERLNRVKHSSYFPVRAIRFCLDQAGATLRDLDAIVTDSDEDFCDFVAARDASLDPRRPFQSGRQLLASSFEREFGVDISDKLRFCRHHLAHLYSAWYPSGFTEALALCIDGYGDGSSGLVAHCRREELNVLRHLSEANSLGNFYMQQLFYLGYQRFDEYKVMGLAPYGDPTVFEPLFESMYELEPEGRFTIVPTVDRLLALTEQGLTTEARRKGQPFTQTHQDYAAALQTALERIVDHVVTHFHKVTGARRLCMSGGVAHNCTLNGKLARSGKFDQIYVQPAAHDAGNAVGAALAVFRDAGQPIRRDVLCNLFLGTDIGTQDAIETKLYAWKPLISFERLDNAAHTAAHLLASGAVIGWAQGRSEFGPRALGNRSILADPRPSENKRIINAMVKKREDYRPFAPAVLEERLADYFEIPPGMHRVPYMIIVLPVRPESRSLLQAVTHVDGSARVQSVSSTDNPLFHALICEFARLTGVPVVLNTSFNNNAEPIVDSVDDCVATFLTSGINTLIVGDWLVRKMELAQIPGALLDLTPSLPPSRRFVQRHGPGATTWLGIESAGNQYTADQPRQTSPELFNVLTDDSALSLRQRCSQRRYDDPHLLARLAADLFSLWSARAIRLLPSDA